MKATGYGIGLAGCVIAIALSKDAAANIALTVWGVICLVGLLCTKGQQ